MESQKMCSCCKTIKSIKQFHKNKRRPDGRQPWCKSCMKKHRKIYMANAEDRRKQHAGTYKECHGCGKILPIETFTNDKHTSTGYRMYCPDCENNMKQKREMITIFNEVGVLPLLNEEIEK
jgi:hypothetical protein